MLCAKLRQPNEREVSKGWIKINTYSGLKKNICKVDLGAIVRNVSGDLVEVAM